MCVKLSDERSIPSVIAQMTLEEKALLVTGNSTFTTYPIKRLGIPSVSLLDGAGRKTSRVLSAGNAAGCNLGSGNRISLRKCSRKGNGCLCN